MNVFNHARKMVTPDQLDRRSVLKGITLGAGAVVLQPFLNRLAAEAAGKAAPPRVIFLMQGNGLWPHHIQPKGVDAGKGDRLIDLPLANLELPEPLAPLASGKNKTIWTPCGSVRSSCRASPPSWYGGATSSDRASRKSLRARSLRLRPSSVCCRASG